MKPLVSVSPGRQIVDEELQILGRVSDSLADISSKTAGAPDYDEALISLRDQMAEAKPEDLPALVEQMTRVAALAGRYGKGRDLPVDPTSPYFAHLRLQEGPRNRDVLIGKRGYIDRERRVQIVDWRNAPVSRIYYRYEEGDDYEEEFGERTVEGTVEARRSITISENQLQRIGCPQGTFISEDGGRTWVEAAPVAAPELKGGQGTAARPPVLSRGQKDSKLGLHSGPALRADKHLPEVAALIDPLQFELITQPDSGLVVLQGGAGTGKTTVALHRVAYLNYQRPRRFRPDAMLIIVPSVALMNYVQRVLPGLGVQGVQAVTAERWFENTRAKVFKGSPRRYNDDTPAIVQRFKKDPLLLDLLASYVQQQVKGIGEELAETFDAGPGAEGMRTQWQRTREEFPIPRLLALKAFVKRQDYPPSTLQLAESKLRQLLRRAGDMLNDWADALTDRERLAAAVARAEGASYTDRQLDQIVSWCSRQSAIAGELEPPPAPAGSQRHEGQDQRRDAEGHASQRRNAEGRDDDHEHHITADGRDLEADEENERPGFDRADDALLLYLCWLKRGELRSATGSAIAYEHLVVDEAQDLSTVEMKVLLEATTEQRCVTLAGDTAQRLVFDNGFSDWETLLRRLDMPAATNTTLALGYRSTREVMALAESLLGELAPPSGAVATRTGAPVELHRFVDQGQAVAMLSEALRSLLLREPLASVALITRYLPQARLYYEALGHAEVPSLRLVQNHEFSFRPGVELCDITQVKGLEFDYVVLLDVTAANYPPSVESRHLLHIGATRAAHQLWLLASSTPSALLPTTL